MSNLQTLKWSDCEPYEIGYIESASTISHSYIVASKDDKFVVIYYLLAGGHSKRATGFATIDEAKTWAWNHYNEKMRPYVKPMPTWIDASERLPEKHTYVLVMYHAHFDDEEIKEFDFCVARFGVSKFDVRDQHFYTRRKTKVTHWMPIPKLPSEADND